VKQVVQTLKTGEIHVLEVPPPQLRPGGALVATQVSLLSAGTERSKIELGEKSLLGKARARPELAKQVLEKVRSDGPLETYRTVMNRLEAPSPLGYSSAGVVVGVGEGCAGVAPGELVACAGAGYANHAEVNFVPANLLARVPEGVTPAQAAYATLGAIAMQGVRQADVRLGERVAVVGLGLVGLLATQLVRAAGGRVLAVDLDPQACALAASLGAERAVPAGDSVPEVARAFTDGAGVDSVVVCASTESSQPVELAGEIARDRARVVVVGAVGMHVPREPYYEKELELRLSRSYGPGRYDPAYEEHGHDYPIGFVRWTEQRNLAEFLRLVAAGLVDVDALTTHRFPVDDAAAAYALISGKTATERRPVGVVLEYPDSERAVERSRVAVRAAPARPGGERVRVGLVGAGNFATRVLLPALAADGRAAFQAVASAGGASARHAAERFGFPVATSDAAALVTGDDVDAVVVATRHDSHAPLAAAGLAAGKAVFCEKPLATTWAGLEEVAGAYAARPGVLYVGFNRRFSPLTRSLLAALPAGVPRVVVCRVNAGPLPADHWTRDPVAGGGRIVGELCHFLDLACSLAEGRPVRVASEAIGSPDAAELNDTVVVQVAFADGSVASIQYLGNGDPAVPKERLEVFAGGTVALLDDFRALELTRGGRRKRERLRRQEKGHREEVRAFLDAACGRESAILSAEDAFWSSALTLQVLEALRLGRPVAVDLPQALGGAGQDAGVLAGEGAQEAEHAEEDAERAE
jgi:predicted dehydrogenase/threonine dehydrogenase-like Zn-dependent dehydrogenase